MKPKILAFDIETSPLLVWSWGLGEQYHTIDQIAKDWSIMAFAAKWVGDKEMIYHDTRKDMTERQLVRELWTLLNDADIVLTQNGKNFDCKKANAKFIEFKMKPPSPYRHIDTLQISRKTCGFTSNKLAYLTAKLGTARKSDHKKYPGLELWKECMKGNFDAWNEMEKYNKQDVLALEELYQELAPWDASIDRSALGKCRVCDGDRLQRRGTAVTAAGVYARFQCQGCGAWQRGVTRESATNNMRKI